MQLVDSFISIILYVRNFSRNTTGDTPAYAEVRADLMRLFDESHAEAVSQGYSEQDYTTAKTAVVAYVDEIILCSSWRDRDEWKKQPLQRTYFDTTNLGDEFYEILSRLNKFGPDREIREVYSLSLGLGFKGKYFDLAERHKYEEVKNFNLGVLLNDEAKKNIDSTILFPEAYGEDGRRVIGNYRPRMNIIPYVIATPLVLVSLVLLYASSSISGLLESITSMVN